MPIQKKAAKQEELKLPLTLLPIIDEGVALLARFPDRKDKVVTRERFLEYAVRFAVDSLREQAPFV